MTRVRVFPSLVFVAALTAPATLTAQSSQQIDDLRRRVEEVERQLFQQRLAAPVTPQGQAISQLQMRLDVLERQIASDRISATTAEIVSRSKDAQPAGARPSGPPPSLEARIAQLEKQQAEDAKTIKDLIARIQKLEKSQEHP